MQVYKDFGSKTISLSNWRTILSCVLSFMGFLWFSEAVKLRRFDVIINKTFLSLVIEKSKKDVYREGSWVYLTNLNVALCPIELVSQYFRKGSIKDNCQKYIFRYIISSKSHSKPRTCDKHVSYTCVIENAIKGLENIGLVYELGVQHLQQIWESMINF